MSSSTVALTALIASIAAVILSVFCALLVWRRLLAMQTQLDSLSSAIDQLDGAHSSLLIRLINSPKPKARKAPKESSRASGTLREQLDESNSSNGSALEVVAPKTSPE